MEDVKEQIDRISSPEEQANFKEQFKSSDEYKVLKTGQGLATKILDLKTSSVKAFESMIKEKEEKLGNDNSLAL